MNIGQIFGYFKQNLKKHKIYSKRMPILATQWLRVIDNKQA